MKINTFILVNRNRIYENVPNDITESEKCENTNTGTQFDSTEVNEVLNSNEHTNYHGDSKNLNIQPLRTYDLVNWSFQISRGMEYISNKNVCLFDNKNI